MRGRLRLRHIKGRQARPTLARTLIRRGDFLGPRSREAVKERLRLERGDAGIEGKQAREQARQAGAAKLLPVTIFLPPPDHATSTSTPRAANSTRGPGV